ncbi:MAG: intradiol ring-cleavage dioxygenase [Leptothrix sp. (in: Bacteria)]|nr:intradiol ring-cleavage dioxygenase [Leptothrix sp. (in: b-proteobacteria)]
MLLGAAAMLAAPARARRAMASMTDGPFYPPRAWREAWPDQDADLSRVRTGGRVLQARGEHLGLEIALVDTDGRAIDGADVEIWQCDALAAYRHPGVPAAGGRFDPGFQGFGATRSSAQGLARLRCIKPVPYPGRTPHIHVKLRHVNFGELSSQLFVAGEPGNARDFLWRGLAAPERDALEMQLQPAAAGSGLRWTAQHVLVLPA